MLCDIENPSDEFSKLSPVLVARLATYIMLNNLANHDDYKVEGHTIWAFRRLSIPRFLNEAGLGDVKNAKKHLLDVRRWLSQIGILNNYDRHRVVYIGYSQLGLTLCQAAKRDKALCLQAFRRAFEAYCKKARPHDSNKTNSLTELRFILVPEETFNGFCQLCELAWRISKASELNPELTKHAFILELVGHFTCYFLREDEKSAIYRFNEYHTDFYQRWMLAARTVFHRYSSTWDLSPLDQAIETLLQFLTGRPAHVANFEETREVVETAILKIQSEKNTEQTA